ncbi:MAG: MTAP family purine nucleoside phosphorylase [Bacteriovoracaceae bacterium]|nr:MTAP family purine nucleoside phosphorylase [Bacteriovoracaceae bacterium]
MKLGIVGGSGIYELAQSNWELVKEHNLLTPFGEISAPILELKIKNSEVTFYFLPRHGVNHQISPSEVNYRANIYALKFLGAQAVLSLSAVGSLQEQYKPGHFVFVDQMLDMTKGLRKRSFFEAGVVGHVSAAYPIFAPMREFLFQEAKSLLGSSLVHDRGTYLCVEGPQFSSRAESLLFKSWGASVIGMTNVPESYLAQEAGLAYTAISMITDFDCWKDEFCTLEEIMKVMKRNQANVTKFLIEVLPKMLSRKWELDPVNKNSIVTKGFNVEMYPWIKTLIND